MTNFVPGARAFPAKIDEARDRYRDTVKSAIFRAYPSNRDIELDIAILDADEKLELFWHAPRFGDWHMAFDLALEFVREGDGQSVNIPLSPDLTGFRAAYRMRGDMLPFLPRSFYFNLEAGRWAVFATATLQDTQALCLFADSFGDLFHYQKIKPYYDEMRQAAHFSEWAGGTDVAPMQPVRMFAGSFELTSPRIGPIRHMLRDRLHHVLVTAADVATVAPPPPRVKRSPNRALPMDPVNIFGRQMRGQVKQALELSHCPYATHCFFNQPPDLEPAHIHIAERISYMYMEATTPVFRATGEADAYRAARRWYEMIVRNLWPSPNGGMTTGVSRTQFGTVLSTGGMCDAIAEFAELHPDDAQRWAEPVRHGLLNWPDDPATGLPRMDQDFWSNEGVTTTGTYNMYCHFAVGMWRIGHVLGDDALKRRAETILTKYIFPAMGDDGIWFYRPGGKYRAPHYDMYVKWQLGRLLLTGAERWTGDKTFLAMLARGVEGSLRTHVVSREDDAILFDHCMTNPLAQHPGVQAAAGMSAATSMLALLVHHDAAFLDPLTRTLRGAYHLLTAGNTDHCWQSSWWRVSYDLLNLAEHGIHVEGSSTKDMRLVRASAPTPRHSVLAPPRIGPPSSATAT